MFKKPSTLKHYALAALVMAIAMAAAETFVYKANYDPSHGLWASGTSPFLKILFYILCLLTVGFAATFAATARHFGISVATVDSAPKATMPLRITSLAVAITLVATVIAQFLAIGSDDKLYFYYVSNSRYYTPAVAVIHTLTLIVAIPAAYWFLRVFLKKTVTVGHGIFPIIYILLLVIRVYFDITYHLNNPRWSARIVTLAVALLFLLFEARQLLKVKRLPLYHTVGVSAVVILTVYSLTNLLLNLMGIVNDGIEVIYDLFLLALAFYAFFRLLQTVTPAAAGVAGAGLTEEPVEVPAEVPVEVPAEVPVEVPVESNEPATKAEATPDTPTEEPIASTEEPVAPAEEPAEDLPDLTEEEVKTFLTEMTAYLAKRQGISAEDTDAYRKVQEQAVLLLRRIMEDEDRNARIAAIRGFIEKRGA